MDSTQPEVERPDSAARLLEAVGIGELEERVYTVLLEHPRATLDDLSEHVDLPRRRVRSALRHLESNGLVSFAPERPVRYLPAPPDVAVEALIDREADAKRAAAQLGHASEEVTTTYYIAKPALAPDVSDILEQLSAERATSDPNRDHRARSSE